MNITVERFAKLNQAQNDYMAEDGLMHCGKCHAPKQARISGIDSIVPITCLCTEADISRQADEARKKRVDDLRVRCLPVVAMHQHIFETAGEARHIQIARRYVAKWDKVRAENIGLMLWGNTGTGKSYTAQCIANALLDQEIAVGYYSAVGMVSNLMSNEKRDHIMADVANVPLLIVDDVGAERDTPFSREQLCAVIDARNEAKKPLIVTTNITLDEMKQCTDHALCRLYDRLQECCVPVAVTGESRRGEVASEKMKLAKELFEK